jgi:hypothetical protein
MQDPQNPHLCSEFMTQAIAAHARLSAALSAMRAARRVSQKLRDDWSHFEAELLNRLRAEQELLLPAFDLAHHAEAVRVRSEHHRLRELVITVEQALAAHQLDERALQSLQTLLERNRSFEERSLFAWAQQCLRPRNRSEFLERTRKRIALLPHAKRVA